jgi:hypothetical protein
MTARFTLGEVVATPGALEALAESNQTPFELLNRHIRGDWGEELCAEDRELNEEALILGDRILSAYKTAKDNQKLYVITEADRSVTTVLLADEY